jgi:DNA-binding protein HU-beta
MMKVAELIEQAAGAANPGEETRLDGFGTFMVKESAARQSRTPGTWATITIPASRKLTFRAAKPLKPLKDVLAI